MTCIFWPLQGHNQVRLSIDLALQHAIEEEREVITDTDSI